ncbi:PLAT domain-containing protein 3-like [Phragmites australis]|uniref:PLAT domain-containing protein 3-like n=1 Tax=Phragmites australis TaxID=29695 RepID=UPI002D78AD38|nr:PLAT domain-containing protein 3-like [Phragmites australis]
MAHKILSLAILAVSCVILAAGSRSPADVAVALAPLRGSAAAGSDDYKCVYTIFVQTGWIWKAGTDSVIGVALAAADGNGFTITDLAQWGGLMGAGHDYYERGNVDIFSGRGPCLPSPPCRMNLTSDGAGAHHGWYCKSVEVTATGPHAGCAKADFGVEQWLARDAPPYQLHAERSICAKREGGDASQ